MPDRSHHQPIQIMNDAREGGEETDDEHATDAPQDRLAVEARINSDSTPPRDAELPGQEVSTKIRLKTSESSILRTKKIDTTGNASHQCQARAITTVIAKAEFAATILTKKATAPASISP
ncbi:hypothetical protein [Halochromatium sp.]